MNEIQKIISAQKRGAFLLLSLCVLFVLIGITIYRSQNNDGERSSKPILYVLVDKGGPLSPEKAVASIKENAEKIDNGFFNPGFTKDGWWMYVPIKKISPGKYWLQVANPLINSIIFYQKQHGAWKEVLTSGDNYPFRQRLLNDPDYWLPISEDTAEVLMYVDKKGESLQVPVRLVADNQLAIYLSDEKIIYGIFTGWFLFLFIMNIFLWASLKDDIHILYILYISASAIWIMVQWGLAFQYLWPDSADFENKSKPFFANLSFLFLLEFTKRYFTAPQQKPVFINFLRVTQILLLISSVGLWLINVPAANTLLRFGYLTTMNIIWITAIVIILLYLWTNRKQTVPALFFLGAISVLSVCVLVILVSQYSLGADWLFYVNKYGSPAGMLAESTILSFGITQRYNYYKKEKEKIQEALEKEKKSAADRVIQSQEEERNRLARELHDGLGGLLGSIRIGAHYKLKANPIEQEWIGGQIDMAIKDLRNIAHDLMPVNLQEQGLEKVLTKTIDRWNMGEDLQVRMSAMVNERYPLIIEAGLYRIVGELMHNIKKHAQATEVNIELWEDPKQGVITLMVEDNGVGFDASKTDGLGWKNIRYRVQYMEGKVFIDSNNNGTTIIVEIPLPNERN